MNDKDLQIAVKGMLGMCNDAEMKSLDCLANHFYLPIDPDIAQ